MMDEGDVRRVLSYPHTMIGSDGLPHDTHPHPRLWGTFPRVLGHYCREVEAVPAGGGGAPDDRPAGRAVRPRRAAAASRPAPMPISCVFDPATIIDRATFEEPMTPAAGIDTVFVNGRMVWRDGAATGERPGRALRRQAMQAEAVRA